MKIDDSPFYILGICEKYNDPVITKIRDRNSNTIEIVRQDIIALEPIYVSSLFPLSSESLYIVLLIDQVYLSEKKFPDDGYNIGIKNASDVLVGNIKIDGFKAFKGSDSAEFKQKYILETIKISDGVFNDPGNYKCYFVEGSGERYIGSFDLAYKRAEPLTQEMICDIKSNPLAIKAAKFIVKCNKCNDHIDIFSGLDESKKEGGCIWYKDLPERFMCKCGKTNQNLIYLKESAHSILGKQRSAFSEAQQIERNYTYASLETIIKKFNELIYNQSTQEQEMQTFLENNEIIFSKFNPRSIIRKPKITTKFAADFAIFNNQNELLLVEIEKPSTKLFTNRGGQSAELTHAFDQVKEWMNEVNRNKLSVLDCMGIEGLTIDNNTNVRGIVIAGIQNDENSKYMYRLLTRTDIEFFTFNALLNNVIEITNSLKKL